MTIDQLIDDLGLLYARDPDGTPNLLKPPNPLPPVGSLYAVVQATGDSARAQLYGGGQDRARTVLVSVYGAADTSAGQAQLVIVLAHLRARAGEVTAHLGIRLRECLPTLLSPVQRDTTTGTAYAHIQYTLSFLAP